jgi:hypothetical protein
VDGSNSVYVVQEEGYGGSNILGVFLTFQKAESFKKKFRELNPNKYSSSSDFWNIKKQKQDWIVDLLLRKIQLLHIWEQIILLR